MAGPAGNKTDNEAYLETHFFPKVWRIGPMHHKIYPKKRQIIHSALAPLRFLALSLATGFALAFVATFFGGSAAWLPTFEVPLEAGFIPLRLAGELNRTTLEGNAH